MKRLLTGDPDRGGHRRVLSQIPLLDKIPSVAPVSHYSERFLASVLAAFVVRAIFLSDQSDNAEDL
eukprot:1994405-Prymnesium_polylepis.1